MNPQLHIENHDLKAKGLTHVHLRYLTTLLFETATKLESGAPARSFGALVNLGRLTASLSERQPQLFARMLPRG